MADEYSANNLGQEGRHVPRTPASEFGYNQYKRPTRPNMAQVTSNITPAIMIPANPNRISLLLINNSSSDIYLGLTSDVSSAFGILLGANGGTFSMNILDEGEAVNHEFFATSASDGNLCTLMEIVIQGDR